jgi:hypothetical protein
MKMIKSLLKEASPVSKPTKFVFAFNTYYDADPADGGFWWVTGTEAEILQKMPGLVETAVLELSKEDDSGFVAIDFIAKKLKVKPDVSAIKEKFKAAKSLRDVKKMIDSMEWAWIGPEKAY